MRTTWNGSLSFGLVSIPVGLAPATKPAARQSDVSFRMLHRECGTPIRQKRWCPQHDREVSPDEIVKGWEVSKGQFVLVEDEDLEALERTDDSRAIEITQFVRLEDVDPIFFDRTYFLVPGQAPAQRRPYALLLQAMRDSGAAALGRFVRSGRESLCLVRARGDALALETLYLAEDVYSQAEIEEALDGIEVKAPEPAAPASDTAPPQPTGTSTDATSSTPEVKPARRRRGRPAEHPWEEAAGYVDDWVEKVGPLERDENGVPIIQRGIDQMLKGFNKAKDPKPPNERQIRTWIDDHAERTNKWWEATSDSTTASVRK